MALPVIVVNQTFASRYFPNGDAVGHSVKVPELKPQPPYLLSTASSNETWILIIGVVGDKLDDGLAKPIVPEVFVPLYDRHGHVHADTCSIRGAALVASSRDSGEGELHRS